MAIIQRKPQAKFMDFPFPYYGDLSAPCYMILDPVVGNLSANNPLSPEQAKWLFTRIKAHTKFERADVCIISCALPVDGETWKSNKMLGLHLKEHRQTLMNLINRNKPKFIMTLGAKATQQIIGRAVQITKSRGQVFEDPALGIPVLPMLSTFYAQRQPETEGTFNADLRTASRIFEADFDIESAAIDYKRDYKWCYDLTDVLKNRPKLISLDVETVGLVPFAKKTTVLTIQMSWETGKSIIIPINYDYGKYRHHNFIPWDTINRKKLFADLKTILEDPRIEKIGQNLKFDIQMLHYQMGIDVQNYAHDTMLIAHLLDENQRRINIDDLVRQHVPEMAGYNDTLNNDPEHHGKTRMDLLSPEKMLVYGSGDTDAALHLLGRLLAQLDEDVRLRATYDYVSMPASRAFCHVERNGFPVDENRLNEFETDLRLIQKKERGYLINQIPKSIRDKWRNSGVGVKVTRRDLLADWLYHHPDGLKLKPVAFTKTGLPSVSSKQALPYYVADHPVLARLTTYIKNDKMLNTYAKGFHKYIFDGLIRPTYKLAATVTGRSACVHADTLIPTQRGLVRIADIAIGDTVTTHKGNRKPVVRKYLKPVQAMYDVTTSAGEKIRCTEEHRFYTPKGWTSLRNICIQAALGRQELPQESVKALHEILCVENGRQKSHARNETGQPSTGEVSKGWSWILNNGSRQKAILCSPGSNCGSPEPAPPATTRLAGSSSHKREYREQSTGQPCLNHNEVTITQVHHCGSYPVFDLEVADDHSYLACGVFNHNSADPNGQNFPKRGDMAKKYRRIFRAPKGWVFISLDLSQAELRIAAMMSGDENMLQVYRDGGDIHRMTAAGTMGLTLDQFLKLDKELQSLKRFQAKAVNFGFLYGMWWKKFRAYAKTDYGIDFTDEEAENIRTMFFKTYPRLLTWHNTVQEYVAQTGFVRTYDGRIRHLPNVFSRDEAIAKQAMRQAINSPVQSIASDLGLMTLGRLIPYILSKGIDWLKPCGFIHDAIVCLVREEHVAHGCALVKQFMENNPLEKWFSWNPSIPIIADAEVGRDLASTYELDSEWFEGANNRNKSYRDMLEHVWRDTNGALSKATSEKDIAKLTKQIATIEADAALSDGKPFTMQSPRRKITISRGTQPNAQAQAARKHQSRRIVIRKSQGKSERRG